MNWSTRKQSLRVAYSSAPVILITIIAAAIIITIQFIFTDFMRLAGNIGLAFAIAEGITGAILAVLFGMNMGLLYYKLKLASTVHVKEGSTTLLGGILGVLVTGCPACSITIASYLGLAAIFTVLPFHGMEIKILGIGLLLYSTDSLLKNLLTCTKKKKNND